MAIDLGILQCAAPDGSAKEVVVAVRPEDIALSRERTGQGNDFASELRSRLFLGDITVYHLSVNGTELRGKTTGINGRLEPGTPVYVRFPADKLKIFVK